VFVLKNIADKKIIAHMLLALMLIVHVAKVFHEHAGCLASSDKHGIKIYQHQEECKICTFHLLGSGEFCELLFTFLVPPVADAFNILPVDLRYFRCCDALYLRGPPSRY